jgi:hypothetical protein
MSPVGDDAPVIGIQGNELMLVDISAFSHLHEKRAHLSGSEVAALYRPETAAESGIESKVQGRYFEETSVPFTPADDERATVSSVHDSGSNKLRIGHVRTGVG